MTAGADFWLRHAFDQDNLRRFETGGFQAAIFCDVPAKKIER
jgi:hypothetical protein